MQPFRHRVRPPRASLIVATQFGSKVCDDSEQVVRGDHRLTERCIDVGLDWPGPEITDLTVNLLHTMLRDGIYAHRTLADALGVSTRGLARAIRLCTERSPLVSDARRTLSLAHAACD